MKRVKANGSFFGVRIRIARYQETVDRLDVVWADWELRVIGQDKNPCVSEAILAASPAS